MLQKDLSVELKAGLTRWAQQEGIKLGDITERPSQDKMRVFDIPVLGNDGKSATVIFSHSPDGQIPGAQFSVGLLGAKGVRSESTYPSAQAEAQVAISWVHAVLNPPANMDLSALSLKDRG